MLRARAAAVLVATLALAAGSAVLAPAAHAVADATITLDVTPTEATEGDTLEVTVTSTDTSDLYAYDLIFAFDPTLLALDEDSVSGPDGGFTTASAGDGVVTLTHTRLGTSPGLTGTVELGSFSFTALGGGDTVIALPSAELVSASDGAVLLPDVAEVEITLVALPDPPAPTSSPTPTASATPSPSASPVVVPAGSTPGQPLAATGADATPWLIAGAAGVTLVAAGALLVIRRRRAVAE